MSFVVVSDRVRTWTIKMRIPGTVCTATAGGTRHFTPGWPIVGDSFEYEDKIVKDRFTGRFTSASASSGTWFAQSDVCKGSVSGTWAARKVIEVGKEPGIRQYIVNKDDMLKMVLNTTNSDGVDMKDITQEWFLLTATWKGLSLGVFALSDGGLVPITGPGDLPGAAFGGFDHGAGDMFAVATLAMSDLEMSSGDALIYGYAYATDGIASIRLPNVVTVTVR